MSRRVTFWASPEAEKALDALATLKKKGLASVNLSFVCSRALIAEAKRLAGARVTR